MAAASAKFFDDGELARLGGIIRPSRLGRSSVFLIAQALAWRRTPTANRNGPAQSQGAHAAQKAVWLAVNFEMIEKAGGVKAVTRQALNLPTRDAKFKFMDAFEGIGPKYARNVWMDIYDPLFRNAVAIDERIKAMTRALGYSFKTYDEHERFYQQLANDVRLEPWELDRLLYEYKEHFMAQIERAA